MLNSLASLPPSARSSLPEIAQRLTEELHTRHLRASLTDWCRHVLADMGQEPAAHHLRLIEELEALTRGEFDRLMVAMPPGSAKSTYVSQLFVAWWLSQDPTKTVLACSHTAELAEFFGRRVRNMIHAHSG